MKDANLFRRDRGDELSVGADGPFWGVVSDASAAALRLAAQVALRFKGGVTGSDDPDEVEDSIEGGIIW